MESSYSLPSSVFPLIEKYNSAMKKKDQNCQELEQLREQNPENARISTLEAQNKDLDEEATKLTKEFALMIQKILGEYSFTDTNASIEFPSNLDSNWRKIVHDESDLQELAHVSKGKKTNRKLIVSKKGTALKKHKGTEFEDCPDPILKVSYKWIKENQFRIEFPQPDENGSAIDLYNLYVFDGSEHQFIKESVSKENGFTLTLKASTIYVFQITAQNSFGESDKKSTFKFMTPQRFGGSVLVLGDSSNEVFNPSLFNYTGGSQEETEEAPFIE